MHVCSYVMTAPLETSKGTLSGRHDYACRAASERVDRQTVNMFWFKRFQTRRVLQLMKDAVDQRERPVSKSFIGFLWWIHAIVKIVFVQMTGGLGLIKTK